MTVMNPLQPLLPKKANDTLPWQQLQGAAIALAISSAAQTSHSPLLLVTPDMATATRLEQELNFFRNNDATWSVLIFPDWETLPYDSFSPHQDIISQRLLTLYQLPNLQKGIVIVPVSTLMQRLMPRGYLEANSFVLAKGEKLDRNILRQRLEQYGYYNVSQVITHGEFAIRGSLLDVFPMGSKTPFRIDLFDHEVDTIRIFDPETQKSLSTIEKINILPAHEFPLTEQSIALFRQNWRNKFTGNPTNSSIYQNISQGETAAGIEYYLALFFDKTTTLFSYLAEQTIAIQMPEIYQKAEVYWQEINERYEQLSHDQTKPLLAPTEVFLTIPELFSELKKLPQIKIENGNSNFPDISTDYKAEQPLFRLKNFLTEHSARTLFTAESTGRREALLDLLKTINIQPTLINSWQEFLNSNITIALTIASIEDGMMLVEPKINLISEAQLFGKQVMQRRLRKHREQDPDAIFRNLTELQINSPVVHIDHGVGLYKGLEIIKTGDIETEFLNLEYGDGAKLYVPVASLHLISRYTGVDADHVSLHHLGSKQWEKARRAAAEKIRDVAAELLDIYARRAAKVGHQFSTAKTDYQKFAAAFPFEETPGQQQAITDVLNDMTSTRIMDRLICGDVGFGKTEVAMRAAFIAVQNSKQVIVLVPTTLLAEQHYENFKDRFADWPIKIAVISRFHTDKKQKDVMQQIENGNVDIVIGTHKLLQPNVLFKNLGLLIIDEEHRFGVQQKERIKSLRSAVDLLALTATPIPRTLNMALAGMRDLSLIATPPARRLAVKTFVHDHETSLIREAVLREIMRGGQLYYLHNDIATIQRCAEELNKLIPEARIGVAHGQMHERELAQAMTDFYHKRFNVLICTTIIESGIDIPSANTIIIERADKFGLAQLHQLRGRVGRSHHQAYAYLLIPNRKVITADALKRLDAIASIEDLGAGFMLASHDLEIRGAGELLGEEQSGHIQAIGFNLYMELLEEAVTALKAGKIIDLEKPLHHGVEIDLRIPALIPDTLTPDVNMRLTLYKRIANAKNSNELKELQVELIDRFGLLPDQTKNLFLLAELKLFADKLDIKKIDTSTQGVRIEFEKSPNIDLVKLLDLIQTHPKQYRLDSLQRLHLALNATKPNEKIDEIEKLITVLRKKN
jgi:transcription-repair coupling factor (superfamily II helicase)